MNVFVYVMNMKCLSWFPSIPLKRENTEAADFAKHKINVLLATTVQECKLKLYTNYSKLK